ncbi:DNA repair protein XRCC3 [Fukomys damarensis]|uniref:DNA repair protein XRCC3 n=1 Tax=Fukomys damarensis TaxID=885580 RepID=A0A091CSI6_FUKDA|nr:DNA repair protein XRCC3 [Fukomys damarensis]
MPLQESWATAANSDTFGAPPAGEERMSAPRPTSPHDVQLLCSPESPVTLRAPLSAERGVPYTEHWALPVPYPHTLARRCVQPEGGQARVSLPQGLPGTKEPHSPTSSARAPREWAAPVAQVQKPVAHEDMELDQLDLNPRILAAVRRARLKSMKEVLRFSGPDLQRCTGLSSSDVRCLLTAAAKHLRGHCTLTELPRPGLLSLQRCNCTSRVLGLGSALLDRLLGGGLPLNGITELAGRSSAGKTQLALQLCLAVQFPRQHGGLEAGPWPHPHSLIPLLDRLLGGGLPLNGITELAGRSSAGKTQLALQLCLAVQFPRQHGGLEAGAVYICTEAAFPSKRLCQLISQQSRLRVDVPGEVVQSIRFGDRIFIEHTADVDALLQCVSQKVPVLLSQGLARLLVVDSVAAPFRCEFDGQASVARARCLQSLGATLRWLSSTFQIPVLCVNQVTEAVEQLGSQDERLCPALGITWANQLLMRLMADRVREEEAMLGPSSCPTRTLRVVFAPHLPPCSCSYIVSEEGVRGTLETSAC